jgi:hypothetical protein
VVAAHLSAFTAHCLGSYYLSNPAKHTRISKSPMPNAFASEHGVVSDMEIIPTHKINEENEHGMKSDEYYCFIIVFVSLNAS